MPPSPYAQGPGIAQSCRGFCSRCRRPPLSRPRRHGTLLQRARSDPRPPSALLERLGHLLRQLSLRLVGHDVHTTVPPLSLAHPPDGAEKPAMVATTTMEGDASEQRFAVLRKAEVFRVGMCGGVRAVRRCGSSCSSLCSEDHSKPTRNEYRRLAIMHMHQYFAATNNGTGSCTP